MTKLDLAKQYLGRKWLLHPDNRVKKLKVPMPDNYKQLSRDFEIPNVIRIKR